MAKKDFSPLPKENRPILVDRPSLSYWQDAWLRLQKNKVAMFSSYFILLLILTVLLGPLFYRVDPFKQNVLDGSQAPNLGRQAIVVNPIQWEPPMNSDMPTKALAEVSFKAIEPVTTLGIRLQWEPIQAADGYNVYRTERKPESIDELGFPITYIDNKDSLGVLDQTKIQATTYYYSLVPTEAGNEGDAYLTIAVQVEKAITLEEAKKIDPQLKEGDLLKIAAKPLGTDAFGRDLLARTLHGGRISLFIGFMAPLLYLVFGIFYGGLSGLIGGDLDLWMMRVADFIDGIPYVLFIILFRVVVGVEPGESGIEPMLIAMVVILWPSTARMVRTQVMQLKEQGFVEAARIMGVHPFYLLLRHLIPNTFGVILVKFSFEIPSAILLESFFSFIGLGVAPPTPSWGALSYEGIKSIRSFPHEILVPSVAISLTVLAFNLFGDGLRDALDPKLRNAN